MCGAAEGGRQRQGDSVVGHPHGHRLRPTGRFEGHLPQDSVSARNAGSRTGSPVRPGHVHTLTEAPDGDRSVNAAFDLT